MDSVLWLIGLGFLLGLQHATDPDHVVAVATIVSRERRLRSGALVGVLWGVGHSLTVAVAGGAIVLLNLTVPTALALWLELAVAVMLLGLGTLRLVWTFRGVAHVHPQHLRAVHDHDRRDAFHSHVHAHDGRVHRHPHLHPPRQLLAALQAVGPAQAARSFAVGVIHGLAGSAAAALVILPAIPSPSWALVYLGVFGAGTILGMMAMAGALAVPFAVSARRFARVHRALAVGTGLASVAVGGLLLYQIGVEGRLLTGSAAWR